MKNRTYNKKKIFFVFSCALILLILLFGRLAWLMIFRAEEYQKKAQQLHERERDIKAARGEIVDRNGKILATNRTVCTISVIHSQLKDSEKVIKILTKALHMEEAQVRKKVKKISSMERIASNVEKKTGDKIRNLGLDGVKVDEDFKRYYPYGKLASKVLGFTGGDNQGIIGLEVQYEDYLKGINGQILTITDARGIELDEEAEGRKEPVKGDTLKISLDANLQKYAEQMAEKVMEEKQAEKVAILLMNPQNGEIFAMVNVPEFDLNDPFSLPGEEKKNLTPEEEQDALNRMWRNECISDTYEPGSTFKIITASACLEEGVVKLSDHFHCPGYKVVEDRKIRCHKVGGHGAENFVEGIQNSCNPVFIDIGLRLGVNDFYKYFQKFGLLATTGVDLPGEAGTIMHKKNRYRTGRTCNYDFWTVFSGYTDADGSNGQFSYKWRKENYTSFWSRSYRFGEKEDGSLFLWKKEENSVSEDFRDHAGTAGRSSGKRLWEKGICKRISYWRQNSDFPDFAKKCRKIHFFLYRISSGRKPTGSGHVCDL